MLVQLCWYPDLSSPCIGFHAGSVFFPFYAFCQPFALGIYSLLIMEMNFDEEIELEDLSIELESELEVSESVSGIQLLGILISDVEPGVGGVKSALQGMWHNLGQIRITRAKKNVFTVTVGDERAARRLIDGAPWNIKGSCFSVRHWPANLSIDEINPHRATYWIQAHGLSRQLLNVRNGHKIGGMIGTVLEVEDPDRMGFRGFLRMRVDFDTRRPLATWIWLPKPNGPRSKIKLAYEDLKNFCYRCGRLGHGSRGCIRVLNPALLNQGVVYNHSLVAEPVRRSTFTFPQQNRSFPIFPVTSAAPTESGKSLQVTNFDGRNSSLGSKNQACDDSFSRLSRNKEASVVTQLPMGERETGERWTLDSNNLCFKNRDMSVATDRPVQSRLWAGPTELPSWTFQKGETSWSGLPLPTVPHVINENEFSFLPTGPTFGNSSFSFVELNESQLEVSPLSSLVNSSIRIVELNESQPNASLFSLDDCITKGKRPSSLVTGQPLKKAKLSLSPGVGCSLRLSKKLGTGKIGGGKPAGKKCSRTNSQSLEVEVAEVQVRDSYSQTLFDLNNEAVGMEDFTHLRGCGDWPNSVARPQ